MALAYHMLVDLWVTWYCQKLLLPPLFHWKEQNPGKTSFLVPKWMFNGAILV